MADRNRQYDDYGRNYERGPRRRDRGERAGQERGWEDANRRRQDEPDIPGEPGNWRRQPEAWRNQQDDWQSQHRDWGDQRWRSDWQERERSGQTGSWQGQGDVDYRRERHQEDADQRNQGRDWRSMGDWAERQRIWEERGGRQSEPADWQDQEDDWQGQGQWGNRQPAERGPNRRQDRWDYQQTPRDDWRGQNQRGDWQGQRGGQHEQHHRGPGGNWQERSQRERWFARDDRESQNRHPEEEYSDENFYANRGWARPSSPERDRDWGYYRGRNVANDRNQDDQRGLPIDYLGSGEEQRNWRNEREFGRGADADRNLSRQRAEWQNPRREDWNRSGPFSGMGPQGYQRSDERIKEEICERLTWHGQIDASKIEIDVKEGEVTLRGEVGRKNEKRLAEDMVEKIDGVKDVQNQLRVSQ